MSLCQFSHLPQFSDNCDILLSFSNNELRNKFNLRQSVMFLIVNFYKWQETAFNLTTRLLKLTSNDSCKHIYGSTWTIICNIQITLICSKNIWNHVLGNYVLIQKF